MKSQYGLSERDLFSMHRASALVLSPRPPLPPKLSFAQVSRHLPLLHVVRCSRDKAELLRVHGQRPHGLLVVRERGHRLARDEVPQLDLAVVRTRNHLANRAAGSAEKTQRSESAAIRTRTLVNAGISPQENLEESTSRGMLWAMHGVRHHPGEETNPTLTFVGKHSSLSQTPPFYRGRARRHLSWRSRHGSRENQTWNYSYRPGRYFPYISPG